MKYIFLLSIVAACFAAIAQYRSRTQRRKLLERRLARDRDDLHIEFDRFNPKDERSTTIKDEGGKFYFESDIQHITIGNSTLVAKISSTIGEVPVRFDIVISPFDRVLFEIEGYKNFNQKGILILWSYGAFTKEPFGEIDKLRFISERISDKPGGVYVELEAYKVDKVENKVQVYGHFLDGGGFRVDLDYAQFRIVLQAPLESLHVDSNFRDESTIR